MKILVDTGVDWLHQPRYAYIDERGHVLEWLKEKPAEDVDERSRSEGD